MTIETLFELSCAEELAKHDASKRDAIAAELLANRDKIKDVLVSRVKSLLHDGVVTINGKQISLTEEL